MTSLKAVNCVAGQLGNQARAACDAMGQQDSARFRMLRRPSSLQETQQPMTPAPCLPALQSYCPYSDRVLGGRRNATNFHVTPDLHIH